MNATFLAFYEGDYKKLLDLSAMYDSPYSQLLREELRRGHVLKAHGIPRELVTMNSCVRFKDLYSGVIRKVTLTYPHEADPESGRISVLSSLGVALIGLRAGQEILWRSPTGGRVQLRVLKVESQPRFGEDR